MAADWQAITAGVAALGGRSGAAGHAIPHGWVRGSRGAPRDDGPPSFAIVVGPASPLALPIAPTMSVVIPAHGHAAWLAGTRDHARELLAIPPENWRADPVSTWVNSENHDDARCVEPLGNSAQGELF